jgi:transposase
MHDRRTIINGILWILRTGAPWRDLPKHYGHWYSIYARFRLWQLDGTWEKVLTALLNRYGIEGKIDWSLFSVDGTIVKAHKASAGALKKTKSQANRQTTPLADRKAAARPR